MRTGRLEVGSVVSCRLIVSWVLLSYFGLSCTIHFGHEVHSLRSALPLFFPCYFILLCSTRDASAEPRCMVQAVTFVAPARRPGSVGGLSSLGHITTTLSSFQRNVLFPREAGDGDAE